MLAHTQNPHMKSRRSSHLIPVDWVYSPTPLSLPLALFSQPVDDCFLKKREDPCCHSPRW